MKLYVLLHCKKNENKQKRGRDWPIFLKAVEKGKRWWLNGHCGALTL